MKYFTLAFLKPNNVISFMGNNCDSHSLINIYKYKTNTSGPIILKQKAGNSSKVSEKITS